MWYSKFCTLYIHRLYIAIMVTPKDGRGTSLRLRACTYVIASVELECTDHKNICAGFSIACFGLYSNNRFFVTLPRRTVMSLVMRENNIPPVCIYIHSFPAVAESLRLKMEMSSTIFIVCVKL